MYHYRKCVQIDKYKIKCGGDWKEQIFVCLRVRALAPPSNSES